MSHLCTYAFQLLRISKQNQCHKCKLDSFPIFSIVRFGISVSFRYFGFVSVSLGTPELVEVQFVMGDCGFEPGPSHTKDFKSGMSCSFAWRSALGKWS